MVHITLNKGQIELHNGRKVTAFDTVAEAAAYMLKHNIHDWTNSSEADAIVEDIVAEMRFTWRDA